MPGRSEIGRHLGRIGRRSRLGAYHDVNPDWGVRHMSRGKMPKPTLDPISGNGVAKRSTDNETNARPGAAHGIPGGRDIVRSVYGMNDERGPTYAKAPPGRPSEVFRAAHSQQSRQHRGRPGTDVSRTDGCGPCGAGRK